MQECLVFIERVYISRSIKGWLCLDQSHCNNVYKSVETDFDCGNEISVSFLLAFGSKTSNLGLTGFLAGSTIYQNYRNNRNTEITTEIPD